MNSTTAWVFSDFMNCVSMIIVEYVIVAIYITHMCALQNWGKVWVELTNAILFGGG